MEAANPMTLSRQLLTNPRGGRRLAIGDIHGFARTLEVLVTEKIKLMPDDQLFLLGDYIDRGKRNAQVLDFLVELQDRGFQVYPLRGNHEQMLLDAWQDFQSEKGITAYTRFYSMIEAVDLIDNNGNLADKYLRFLESLPYYYELDHYYLVHAGFNFYFKNPFEDYESMLWIRDVDYNPLSKTIIHGHETTPLAEITQSIRERNSIICIDNGCYFGISLRDVRKYDPRFTIDKGNLCALDLDTYQLFIQENID